MSSVTLTAEHPLSVSQQTWNILVFSVCNCLQYLAAPVLYVGMTQAALCKKLGAGPTIANLPESAFFVLTITPVILAWRFPGIENLKRTLACCYIAGAGGLLLVVATLVAPVPDSVRIAAIIAQGAISGATMPTALALLWEAMGLGVAESRRGLALSLAFGIGPFLAFAASLLTQELLNGTFGGVLVNPLSAPWNFVAVFSLGIPLMLLCSWSCTRMVIPQSVELNPLRTPFLQGLREFVATPILWRAAVVTVLLNIGNTISTNMNLYTEFVLGAAPEAYVGYQNALRFFCKGVAGLLLGWLLYRSHPRRGIVICGCLLLCAQIWAMNASGNSYLMAFGLFGAGELIGVYAPNYLLSASTPGRMRHNMAYVTLMMLPAAPAGYLFGSIAGSTPGAPGGFLLSFLACASLLGCGLLLTILWLPKRPGLQSASERRVAE